MRHMSQIWSKDNWIDLLTILIFTIAVVVVYSQVTCVEIVNFVVVVMPTSSKWSDNICQVGVFVGMGKDGGDTGSPPGARTNRGNG